MEPVMLVMIPSSLALFIAVTLPVGTGRVKRAG